MNNNKKKKQKSRLVPISGTGDFCGTETRAFTWKYCIPLDDALSKFIEPSLFARRDIFPRKEYYEHQRILFSSSPLVILELENNEI